MNNNQNCLSCIHAFSDDNDELICTVEEEHEKVGESYSCKEWSLCPTFQEKVNALEVTNE
ncbi:hypothetical protein ACQKLN_29865 [Paenibacillus glucanolyticus]|uniref:hypothetical protein n=1 Tax=Paenibacillus glucanolyticus TaxID=59843 RepID=UPI0036B99246